jgi:hypothetical protein
MDIIRLESEFATGLISTLVSGFLKSKMEVDVDIRLKKINVGISENETKIDLDLGGVMSKEELQTLIEGFQ